MNIWIGRPGNISRRQDAELGGCRLNSLRIGTGQMLLGQGVKLVADAQGENGEDKVVENIEIQGTELDIAKGKQAFDTGEQQQGVDTCFLCLLSDRLVKNFLVHVSMV